MCKEALYTYICMAIVVSVWVIAMYNGLLLILKRPFAM